MLYPHLYTDKPVAFCDDQAIYTADLARLRQRPGLDGQVSALLPASRELRIFDSRPRVVDGLTWWPVQCGARLGWIAEESPAGTPILAPITSQQQQQVIAQEAERLDLLPSVAMAVFAVEAAPHDLPGPHLPLSFEPHILGDHLFKTVPGAQARFYRHFTYGDPPWTVQGWRAQQYDPFVPLGGAQHNERQAIDLACGLFGREIALKATSMGPGQVMGFCHEQMGYPDAATMFTCWCNDRLAAVRGFFRYIEITGLIEPLQQGDWATFAAGYNGSGTETLRAAQIGRAVDFMANPGITERAFGRRIVG
jgi:hypothetical protein